MSKRRKKVKKAKVEGEKEGEGISCGRGNGVAGEKKFGTSFIRGGKSGNKQGARYRGKIP